MTNISISFSDFHLRGCRTRLTHAKMLIIIVQIAAHTLANINIEKADNLILLLSMKWVWGLLIEENH